MSTFLSHIVCVFLSIAFLPPQDRHDIHRIVVIKSEFSLFLYRGEELQKKLRIAVGKNPGNKQRKGDLRTPEGEFIVSQIQDSRAWVHDFNDGKGPTQGAYGPWFMRLRWNGDASNIARGWRGIGIHGTHDTSSIGTMVSEGCVRLKNEDVEELVRLVKIGTSVQIVP